MRCIVGRVFVHVLSAFAFVMVHGGPANVAFKLRRETSRKRLAAFHEQVESIHELKS